MQKFLMLGRYSLQGLKGASAARSKKAVALVKKNKGRINAIYALVGNYDLAILGEFPNVSAFMKAAIGLSKLTGVSFASFPAVSLEEFDKKILK